MTNEEIKNKYFKNDEEVLWSGKPDALGWFVRLDFILIPLTVLLGGYMLLFAFSAFMLMLRGENMTFALSGITVLLIAFYIIFGRLWYRRKRASRNLYFITSKRVFVFNTFRDTIDADILLQNTKLNITKNTLFLGERFFAGDLVYALGLDLFFHKLTSQSPAFYNIKNPEEIKGIIARASLSGGKEISDDTNDFI
ncbi:MAG: hypothetical protein IKU87_01875 [Clostridia bacterium]|nr:hypothetical protein [Clostridia bacterium]